jgi:glycosyltransferase involved in cell wall biosynthesis
VKIAAVCIAWKEPRVGRVIESFLRQSHPDRELIVLDDAGWYPRQPHGDRWRVVSIDRRFVSLGAKRNAAAALASSDCDAFAVADADDLYLPHWLASIDAALQTTAWVMPTQALEWNPDGSWRRVRTWAGSPVYRAYHGAWACTRNAFELVGGYPMWGEDDIPLASKLLAGFGPAGDAISDAFPDPYYAYSRGAGHISEDYIRLSRERPDYHREAYRIKGLDRAGPVPLVVGWDRDYAAMPIPDEVFPRPW